MSQLFKNAARSPLMAPLAAVDTSLTADITVADLFPAADTGTDPVPTVGKDFYKIVVEDASHNYEIIYVRTRTLGSATMSNLLRGQEGTTAISFAAGSIIELRLTADDLQEAIDLAAQATTPGKNVLQAASVDAQVQALGRGLQKQIATAFTTTGTSTAYLLTPTPAITAYVANLSFDVTFDEVCGAAPTLQINGVATPPNLVKQLTDGSYANIAAGDITANHRSRVTLLSPTQALVERLPNSLLLGTGADIASAATIDLTGINGIRIVTGTIEITTATQGNGDKALIVAQGALPINIAGVLMYQCVANDMVLLTKDDDSVQHAFVYPVNGKARNSAPIMDVGTPAVGSNNLNLPAFTGTFDFRSATAGSGAVSSVSGKVAALVVPDGATLGATSGKKVPLERIVINNAGTLEQAIRNADGDGLIGECGVINTTAIGTGSDSAGVVYSASARSNVPYRVIQILHSEQAAAGTYVTSPSEVSGISEQVKPVANCQLRLNTANGYGSTNNRTRRFTNVVENTLGDYATYSDSATLGGYITTLRPAKWSGVYSDQFTASDQMSFALNEATPTGSPSASEILGGVADTRGTNVPSTASFPPIYLPAGSIIRTHVEGGTAAGVNGKYCQLLLSRVGD